MQQGFELVNPCGEIGPRTGSLVTAAAKADEFFQATLHRLFGCYTGSMTRALCVLLVLLAGAGCSHVSIEDRYHSQVQLVRLTECEKLEALRLFEIGLFRAGFVRTVVREEQPISFELGDRLVNADPKLIEFTKSDFQAVTARGSIPYREIRNRYPDCGLRRAGW